LHATPTTYTYTRTLHDALPIYAKNCKYDVLALGECMVRLSPPGHGRIEFARTMEVDVGGGEYNVAYAATRLGLRGGFISKLPDKDRKSTRLTPVTFRSRMPSSA